MKSENMIKVSDLYHIMCAMVPLYFAMLLAYGSIKWLKLFTKEQCSGIQKFVSLFAIPLLSFSIMSQNNPYQMNKKFIFADTFAKILILVSISLWAAFFKKGSIDWVITLFSLGTLPNTVIIGIPLLQSMYGDFTRSLMIQVVGLQLIVWFNLLIVLYECRAATLLVRNGLITMPANMTKVDIESDGTSPPKADGISIQTASSLSTTPRGEENGEVSVKDQSIRNDASAEQKNVGNQKKLHSTFIFRLILSKVLKKLLVNPNIYASVLGLIWSLIAFKLGVSMPKIVTNSTELISNVTVAMSMFSLGLFMAQQPQFIACGIKRATMGVAVRFIVGPLVVAASSLAIGLRGGILRTSIVQAALPQAVISFVYALEYGLHAEIFSTVVTFSTITVFARDASLLCIFGAMKKNNKYIRFM